MDIITKENVELLIKIVAGVVAGIIGPYLFVRFIFHIFLKYFSSIDEKLEKLLGAIYGTKENPKLGLEHRVTEIESKCEIRHARRRK